MMGALLYQDIGAGSLELRKSTYCVGQLGLDLLHGVRADIVPLDRGCPRWLP